MIYCIGLCLQDYLLDILREKKKSEKHTTYKFGLSKARDALKNPGFGPIADESQVSGCTLFDYVVISSWTHR